MIALLLMNAIEITRDPSKTARTVTKRDFKINFRANVLAYCYYYYYYRRHREQLLFSVLRAVAYYIRRAYVLIIACKH